MPGTGEAGSVVLPALDEVAMAQARARLDGLTKPRGSLGHLEELAVSLAGMTGDAACKFPRKRIFVLAADHGVAAAGVSAYPPEVTGQMVANFLAGGAAINVLARRAGADVTVVDMGTVSTGQSSRAPVARRMGAGTDNMADGPAMTREQAAAAVVAGRDLVTEAVQGGCDMVATGEMGIGNTTAASAITAALTGLPAASVTGRGTGIDDQLLEHKVRIVHQSLAVNGPDSRDPLDVLAKVGGFEIGGLAGVMLEAASRRIPVVLDGFISGAAALLAAGMAPGLPGFLVASHRSQERGHAVILGALGLRPLLDLDMRLGEGTGAALAFHLVDDIVAIRDEMATFAQAGVSGGEPQ